MSGLCLGYICFVIFSAGFCQYSARVLLGFVGVLFVFNCFPWGDANHALSLIAKLNTCPDCHCIPDDRSCLLRTSLVDEAHVLPGSVNALSTPKLRPDSSFNFSPGVTLVVHYPQLLS